MPCSGSQGTWNSQPLDPEQYYLSPTTANANPCLCNAVFYSVVSACAYCQGAVVSTWFQWIPSCGSYQSQTYPVSVVAGSSLPGWATLPVPASGTWDATAAYNYALSPSASITLGGSTTDALPTASASGTGGISLPSLSKSSAPAPTQSSSSSGGSVVGAAVGGTIGGLGLLAGIGFCIWYFCIRKPSGEQSRPGALDDEGKINSPPVQIQPWNSTLTNTGYNYASLPQHSPDAQGAHPGSYFNAAPTPAPPTMSPAPPTMSPAHPTMSPAPPSNISYASPQSYAPQSSQPSHPSQPSQYGSEYGGPTTYSESNSAYGAAPVTVTYGIANPGPTQQYPMQDPNQYSPGATSYNPNAGYNNPAGGYQQQPVGAYQQQPAAANPLLEGFDGGMHAPPPRYETPAPGSSLMGPGAAGATGWPNEKR
ncbi:hypothetical protein FS837_007701 [Tulasnella sp. UAMH 9824]|nr:hypothetical protein FS837_007701 [Tulasnella sp. UAMH 9824]